MRGAALWGSIVRKGFLEKADFERGLGDSLIPGPSIIVSEGRSYGPAPTLKSQLYFCL